MYLSRIRIDLGSRAGIGIAADAYEGHQFVYSGFEDSSAARPLYRIESGLDGVAIIVQSMLAPVWERAKSMRGVGAQCEVKEYSLDGIHAGERLRFKILANAVKTLRCQEEAGKASIQKKANRVPIIRDQELIAWLGRQGTKGGFSLCDTRVYGKDRITTYRGKDRRGSPIVLAATLFEGILTIEEAVKFVAVAETGIGHGKAFGMGLISIARSSGSPT